MPEANYLLSVSWGYIKVGFKNFLHHVCLHAVFAWTLIFLYYRLRPYWYIKESLKYVIENNELPLTFTYAQRYLWQNCTSLRIGHILSLIAIGSLLLILCLRETQPSTVVLFFILQGEGIKEHINNKGLMCSFMFLDM